MTDNLHSDFGETDLVLSLSTTDLLLSPSLDQTIPLNDQTSDHSNDGTEGVTTNNVVLSNSHQTTAHASDPPEQDFVRTAVNAERSQESDTLNLAANKAIRRRGDRLNNRIVGKGKNDVLSGGAGNDTLLGRGGNDRLRGGKGNDTLKGDRGRDNLKGGSGRDRLFGGADRDTLNGGRGNDRLRGNSGNDRLVGGGGNDTLLGDRGNDTLIGGNGNDTLQGTVASAVGDIDVLTGGSGADIFTLSDGQVTFYDDGNANSDGRSDYALITDFVAGVDRVVLNAQDQYRVASSPSGLPSGTALYIDKAGNEPDELIAIFQNTTVSFGDLGLEEPIVAPPLLPPERTFLDYSQSSRSVIVRLDDGFTFISDYDEPVKIMPLGDSITRGQDGTPGAEGVTERALEEGYRLDLWEKFQDLGLEIDFVGSLSNGPDTLPDRNHEGHGGEDINFISDEVDGYLNDNDPDVILLMIGTNDLNQGSSNNGAAVANELSNLIDRIIDDLGFQGDLLVASPPPIDGSGPFFDRIPDLDTYVDLIPGIVDDKVAEGKNVSYVDVNGSLNATDDLTGSVLDNGLHPNEQGYAKIAQQWFDAYLDAAGTQTSTNNSDNVIGSNLDDVIVGNNRSNFLEGRAGMDELTGNAGADQFVYRSLNHGLDTITDFNGAAGDRLRISASGFGGGLVGGLGLSTTASTTGVLVTGLNPQAIGSRANFLYNTSTGLLSFDRDGTGAASAVAIATLEGTPSLTVNHFEIVA